MLEEKDAEIFKAVWKKINTKLSMTAVKSYDKLLYTTHDGVHDNWADRPAMWTNGFWPALMILMYSATGSEQYLKTARNACDMLDNALFEYFGLNHDVGFMWNISSGADYRITGDKKQLNRMMIAANHMMGRYNCDGEFMRAWKGENEADKTMKYHMRENGVCSHIVEYNPVNGEFVKTHAGQGYNENSCWTRGQAWGIYGFALSYKFTKKPEYLRAAEKAADYFIVRCEEMGYATPCDFMQPKEPKIYDTTAGACAACGFLELSEHTGNSKYEAAAVKIIKLLADDFCDWSDTEDSILQKGTEAYNRGIHMPIIYGDYFLTEATARLLGFKTDFIW